MEYTYAIVVLACNFLLFHASTHARSLVWSFVAGTIFGYVVTGVVVIPVMVENLRYLIFTTKLLNLLSYYAYQYPGISDFIFKACGFLDLEHGVDNFVGHFENRIREEYAKLEQPNEDE